MSRRNEILIFSGGILSVTILVGWLSTLLPPDFFEDESNKILLSSGIALGIGMVSALWSQAVNFFSERPRLKIEHVNVKTEREPIQLPPELFWFVVREGAFLEFIDGNVDWKVTTIQINELKYYQLSDLDRLIPKYITRLKATSSWVSAFLTNIKEYEAAKTTEAKRIAKQNILPYLAYLSNSYEKEKKSNLHNDFATKPEEVLVYLRNSIEGLHAAHLADVERYEELSAWVSEALKLGENMPQKINNKDKEVPKINFIVGVSNLGKFPALVKWNAQLLYKGKTIKLRMPDSRNFFGKIDAADVTGVKFIVDTNKTPFDDNKLVFEDLISGGLKDVRLILDLAEGAVTTRKHKLIEDDPDLPF